MLTKTKPIQLAISEHYQYLAEILITLFIYRSTLCVAMRICIYIKGISVFIILYFLPIAACEVWNNYIRTSKIYSNITNIMQCIPIYSMYLLNMPTYYA